MNTQSKFKISVVTDVELTGTLALPEHANSLVLFAHGSGSSRFSPRNNYVADVLNAASIATLLLDLLTSAEEKVDQRTREYRFDIDLLTGRLVGAVDWATRNPQTRDLPIGLFGASTGAAAALIAAAKRPETVAALVSRGGRPDLAGDFLGQVETPSLFIVGELDAQVIQLNRNAAALMKSTPETRIVQGATHLFEEPGTLEEVAALARDWFLKMLAHQPSKSAIDDE